MAERFGHSVRSFLERNEGIGIVRIDRQDLMAAPVGERPCRAEAVAKTVTAVLMVVLLVASAALTIAGFR